MSLILDALNRADQQRSTTVDSIGLQASQSPAKSKLASVLPWAVSTLSLIAVIFLAIYLLRLQTSPITKQSKTIEAVPISLGKEKEIQRIESNEKFKTTELLGNAQLIESSEQVKKIDKVELKIDLLRPTKKLNTLPVKTAADGKKTDPRVLSLYDRETTDVANVTATNSESLTTGLTEISEPESAEDPTIEILQQIPLITDKSNQFQRSIPSIDYEVHVYSAQQGSGFVKLNGKIHKVGAQIGPELRVIAILENSVVLDIKGVQFRLPALNSWVNYN